MKKAYLIEVPVPFCHSSNSSIFYQKDEEIQKITAKEVNDTIQYYFERFPKEEEKEVELSFTRGSFASLDKTLQIAILEQVYPYIKEGKISNICINARAEEITKEELQILKKYKVKSICIEAISMSPYILEKAGVTYQIKQIKKVAKILRWKGFRLGFRTWIGLPESTKIDEQNTAKELMKLKPSFIRISPTFVERGTNLEEMLKKEEYVPLSIVQAVERCKEMANICNKKRVTEIKIENQSEEEKKKIVEGPCHPEFRALVEGAMWYDVILEKIKQINTKVKEVEIRANPEDVPNMLGYKNENIEKLKEVYDLDVVITPDETIKNRRFEMDIAQTYDEMVEEQRMYK